MCSVSAKDNIGHPVFVYPWRIVRIIIRLRLTTINGKWLPDFIERLKASAWHQLYLPLLPFTHARSESINAYSSEEEVVAGHSRQFTSGGLPDNCETHCVSGNRTHDLSIVSPTRYQLCHRDHRSIKNGRYSLS